MSDYQQVNLANIIFSLTEIYMLTRIFRDLKDLCQITDKKNRLTPLDPVSSITNLNYPITSINPAPPVDITFDPISWVLNGINSVLQPPDSSITTLKDPVTGCLEYPPQITVPNTVKCRTGAIGHYQHNNGCWDYTSLQTDTGVLYGWKIQNTKNPAIGYDFGNYQQPDITAHGLIKFEGGGPCDDIPITWRSTNLKSTDAGNYLSNF